MKRTIIAPIIALLLALSLVTNGYAATTAYWSSPVYSVDGLCFAQLWHTFTYDGSTVTNASGVSKNQNCAPDTWSGGVIYDSRSEETAWVNLHSADGWIYVRSDEYGNGYHCTYNGATQQPC